MVILPVFTLSLDARQQIANELVANHGYSQMDAKLVVDIAVKAASDVFVNMEQTCAMLQRTSHVVDAMGFALSMITQQGSALLMALLHTVQNAGGSPVAIEIDVTKK